MKQETPLNWGQVLIICLIALAILSGCRHTKRGAKNCIERSDKTDSDICNCLRPRNLLV